MDYDYITIEPNEFRAGYAVYGHGAYGPNSVLEGQSLRVFLASYKTPEGALEAYPAAEVIDHSSRRWRGASLESLSGLPETPPEWFDPLAAGETW